MLSGGRRRRQRGGSEGRDPADVCPTGTQRAAGCAEWAAGGRTDGTALAGALASVPPTTRVARASLGLLGIPKPNGMRKGPKASRALKWGDEQAETADADGGVNSQLAGLGIPTPALALGNNLAAPGRRRRGDSAAAAPGSAPAPPREEWAVAAPLIRAN